MVQKTKETFTLCVIRELEKSVEIRESTILVSSELIGFPFFICNDICALFLG